MDFGLYPPEVNSGRMYAGPGSGPLLAAAEAWNALADELYTTASSYGSVTTDLTGGPWSGPSSTAMAAAAASYVTWLSATAAQAEHTAAQAHAAVAGYEAAFASTVPPPVIAANRSLLAVLVATNFFGQNTAAIAATEAQYAEMWAQDAVAMYTYAASSASASVLTPFASPADSTDPTGTAGQAAAVSQATGTAAGDAQGAVSAVPQATSGATTSAASDPLGTLSDLISIFLGGPADLATLNAIIPADAVAGPADYPVDAIGSLLGSRTDDTISGWAGVEDWPGTGLTPPEEFPATITDPGPLSSSSTASAAFGQADSVGALSVPSGWTTAAPEIRSVAKISPLTGPAAPAVPGPAAAGSFNQMGLAGMAGQGMAGHPAAPAAGDSAGTRSQQTNRRGRQQGIGAADEVEATAAPRSVVTGVAAAIRLIAKQRDDGYISEQEYAERKQQLLDISTRHRTSS